MEDAPAREGHGRLCGAAKRQGPGHCRKPAGWGTPHPGRGRCRLHGGSTRSQVRRAADEEIEEQARALLAGMDVSPVDDPLAELQRLAGRVLAWERAIGELVNRLDSVRYETEFGEQLRSEVALLERAMDRCGHVLVAIAKLNIDERLARVTEKQAELAERALVAALAEMGLDGGQQAEACRRMGRHLRVVQ